MWENSEIIIQIIKRNKPTKTIQAAMNGSISSHIGSRTRTISYKSRLTKAAYIYSFQRYLRYDVRTLSSKQPALQIKKHVCDVIRWIRHQAKFPGMEQSGYGRLDAEFLPILISNLKPSFSRPVQTSTPSTVQQRHILMDIILITWSSHGQRLG